MQHISVPQQIYPVLHDLSNPYDIFLNEHQYLCSLQEGILRVTDAAREHCAASLQSGTWTLSAELQALPDIECIVAEDLRDGMHSLGPRFDIALGGVLVNHEMHRDVMRAGCAKILAGITSQDKTRIENSFVLGLKCYRDGCKTVEGADLFREALRQLRAAVEGHRGNPAAYLHIGHLYHYQESLRDFTKAWDHYNLCYLTALPDPDLHFMGAQACFYAGWLSAAVFSNLNEAITWTQHALDLDPRLLEARYHLAKLYALAGKGLEAAGQLRELIENGDARYCAKLSIDQDFRAVREEFATVLYEIAGNCIHGLEAALADGACSFSDLVRMLAQDKLAIAGKLANSSDVYDFLKAIVHIDDVWRKDAEDRRNRETVARDGQHGEAAGDAPRREDPRFDEQAAREAAMKAELTARMEAVMKARIAREQVRARRKEVAKNLLVVLLLILAAMSLASFAIFGLTLAGFILLLLASLTLLVRALL
jgi:tetratricopeptide (TPR) repeat protein